MHIRNQPPVFVPEAYRDEIGQMSKAALMDLVWDFATTSTGDGEHAIDTLRARRDIILKQRERDARNEKMLKIGLASRRRNLEKIDNDAESVAFRANHHRP
ncbi:MAG TPA: hypothetical protein VGJ20_20245 [Xanthobacteraceae bacterium]|jgi:hypothetical protein